MRLLRSFQRMRKIYFRFLFKEDRRCSRNLGDHVPQRNRPDSLYIRLDRGHAACPRNSLRPTAANAPSRTSQSVSGGNIPNLASLRGGVGYGCGTISTGRSHPIWCRGTSQRTCDDRSFRDTSSRSCSSLAGPPTTTTSRRDTGSTRARSPMRRSAPTSPPCRRRQALSTASSTNGSRPARGEPISARLRPRSALSTGCSASTSRAWPTPRRSPSARARTTSGR